MKCNFSQYKPIAEAISLLLFPHAEVVIHNLKTGLIEAIFNNLSRRNIGDESLLDEFSDPSKSQNIFPPYFKTNWNGKKMKSVTAVIRDQNRNAIGLLCINLDISKWEEFHHFISAMIEPSIEEPEYLFKNDWREKINAYVSMYLKNNCLSLESLNKIEKRKLLSALQNEGAFASKNAASYVADVLQISRATVYNYLKDIKK
jgi:predicted transcriptional regulator YheO